MAGPRPNKSSAPGTSSSSTTHHPPNVEMITLPSGASYPSFLEPLTPNEHMLLETYDRIKHYEKEAARLKAEEAKRRLEEADERYRKKVEEQKRAEGGGSDADENDAGGSDDDNKPRRQPANEQYGESDDDSIENEEERQKRKKRAAEISKLRMDVEAAKKKEDKKEAEKEAAKRREEAMRRELLGEAGATATAGGGEGGERKRPMGVDSDEEDEVDSDDNNNRQIFDTGPSIKKKKVESNPWDDDGDTSKPSLIANLGGDTTPIHDFSKKLGMSKASLDGTVLFPDEGNMPWSPPDKPIDFLDGCLELELPDFDATATGSSGNNTIAIKFTAPQESKRFSLNIASPNNDGYNDILFHFNPRHFQKGGQLVINDRKESMWGNDISVPLSTLPLMFGVQSCTLIVQINEEGFDVFVEGQHCARLEHRTLLPKGKGSLFLQFPSSDDYGKPELWSVYRVWWGRKRSMADVLDGVAGVNIYSSVHPRKLFVSGLPKLRSDPEVDLRRAELERAFRKYGVGGAVMVSVQKHSTFAFVEVASEQQAELALREMAGRYRVNRARRTKHEALLEERAEREAMEKGGGVGGGVGKKKESGVDWD